MFSFVQHQHRDPLFDESIAVLVRFSKAFVGLSVADARIRLEGAELVEEQLTDDLIDGCTLCAEFKHHEILVVFVNGKAVNAAIQILPR